MLAYVWAYDSRRYLDSVSRWRLGRKTDRYPKVGSHRSSQLSHFHSKANCLTSNCDRLGPGPLCCRACTWTNISSSYRIQRNHEGLKIAACMHSWGKLWTRYKKTKNPTATSEEPGAKAGHCACPLHSAPPKGWADHLSHTSGPTPRHTPTLTPM